MTRNRIVPGAPNGADATAGQSHAPTALARSVTARCRSVLGTWPRRCLVLLTLMAGTASAVAVVAGASPGARTMAAVSGPVQSLMSITVPFFGVLLVQDLRRPTSRSALVPSVLAALAVAVLVALFGIALCGLVTAVAHSQAPGGRWEHAGTVVVGSLLVQVLAQLTGTGFGLLVRRAAFACLLTVVLPLGLWLLLGALDGLQSVQAWLTPFASARNLLAGDMNPTRWAQWLLVLAVWGIGLNLFGLRVASRIRTTTSRATTPANPASRPS